MILIYSIRLKRISSVITSLLLAASQGLEPQYHPPEGCVLPLDELAILCFIRNLQLDDLVICNIHFNIVP